VLIHVGDVALWNNVMLELARVAQRETRLHRRKRVVYLGIDALDQLDPLPKDLPDLRPPHNHENS
jgi:hypothetical protein